MIWLMVVLILVVAYIGYRLELKAGDQLRATNRLLGILTNHMPLRERIDKHVGDLAAAIEAGTQATKDQSAQSRVVHHIKI